MLRRAVLTGHKHVAEFLISHGADVNAKENIGWTPLHSAVLHDHIDLAKLLLKKGADINAEYGRGRNTPLSVAKGVSSTEIVELLRKHGAKE
ncbi:MAG: ankyrin repeat domain-containing protein [Phycisphaerae bacterium]